MDIRKIDRFCGMVLPQTLGKQIDFRVWYYFSIALLKTWDFEFYFKS